jgi:hypothetical protein
LVKHDDLYNLSRCSSGFVGLLAIFIVPWLINFEQGDNHFTELLSERDSHLHEAVNIVFNCAPIDQLTISTIHSIVSILMDAVASYNHLNRNLCLLGAEGLEAGLDLEDVLLLNLSEQAVLQVITQLLHELLFVSSALDLIQILIAVSVRPEDVTGRL